MTLLRTATKDDLAQIEALLVAEGFPYPAPGDPPVHFQVAENAGTIQAVNGWEIHGSHALLRSVVVTAAGRGQGLGTKIVRATLDSLKAAGMRDVTLVTLDAAQFFSRFGFVPVDQDSVAPELHRSPEYTIHVCAGGQWMTRSI